MAQNPCLPVEEGRVPLVPGECSSEMQLWGSGRCHELLLCPTTTPLREALETPCQPPSLISDGQLITLPAAAPLGCAGAGWVERGNQPMPGLHWQGESVVECLETPVVISYAMTHDPVCLLHRGLNTLCIYCEVITPELHCVYTGPNVCCVFVLS